MAEYIGKFRINSKAYEQAHKGRDHGDYKYSGVESGVPSSDVKNVNDLLDQYLHGKRISDNH